MNNEPGHGVEELELDDDHDIAQLQHTFSVSNHGDRIIAQENPPRTIIHCDSNTQNTAAIVHRQDFPLQQVQL